MESNPTAIALIGVIGGILVCMLGLLISMVWDMKKDLRCTKDALDSRVKGTECVKKNDDLWTAVNELQRAVWSGGGHEKR
jgi:hypothetical protein